MLQQSNRYRLLAAALFFTAIASALPVSQADEREEIADLIQRWKTASPAVRTAKVKCLHLSLMCALDDVETPVAQVVATSMTSDQYRTLFQKLAPLAGTPNQFEAMQRAMSDYMVSIGKINGQHLGYTWSELNITQDATTLKNDAQAPLNRWIRKETQGKFAEFDSHSNMAKIEDGGQRGDIYSTSELRLSTEDFAEDLSTFNIQQLHLEFLPMERARLSTPECEVLCDAKTGFVMHALSSDEAKKVFAEVWQAQPKRFPGGIELPMISADITYSNDFEGQPKIYHADLFVIVSAEFNQKIAPDELNLPVPIGTDVRDLTQPGVKKQHQRQFNASDDIPDVMSVVFPPILVP